MTLYIYTNKLKILPVSIHFVRINDDSIPSLQCYSKTTINDILNHIINNSNINDITSIGLINYYKFSNLNVDHLLFFEIAKYLDLITVSDGLKTIDKMNNDYNITFLIVNTKTDRQKIILLKNRLQKNDNIALEWLDNSILSEIYLSVKRLNIVSNNIISFKNLKHLDLQHNNLNYLPKNIGNITSLNNLILFGNNLKVLPSTIGKLYNLKILLLNHNMLKTIPKAICKLFNLKTLRLNNNKLMKLPFSIYKLNKLTTLNINNNLFNKIPNNIDSLINLKYLYINNIINNKELPYTFTKLINLKYLNY